MARIPRQRSSVEWYHVMNRGARRYPTFVGDSDRRSFLRLLGEVNERFGLEVHGYCLMGNHYHLLVHSPEENLSEAMQHLGSVYTQRFNRVHGFDGPLFRGRFRSKAIEDDAYLIAVARYIERNPLAFTERIDAYEWSSLRSYLGLDRSPSWLATSVVRSLFNNSVDSYARCVFGDSFRISDDQIDSDLEAGAGASGVSHGMVEAAVLAQGGVVRNQLVQGARGSRNEIRLLLVYLCAEFADSSTSEIAELYGFSGPVSVRSALRRARARIESDKDFARRSLAATQFILDGSAQSAADPAA